MQVDNITLEMTADRRARLVESGNVLYPRRRGQQLDHANKRWLHLDGRLPVRGVTCPQVNGRRQGGAQLWLLNCGICGQDTQLTYVR